MRLTVLRLSCDGKERTSTLMIVEHMQWPLSRRQSQQESGSNEVSRQIFRLLPCMECGALSILHITACNGPYGEILVGHFYISCKQHESTLHYIYSHTE